MAAEKKILEYVLENLAFCLPWQPIKISEIWTKSVWLVADYSRTISVFIYLFFFILFFFFFCENIFTETEIYANFHFSNYKSMGI